MFRRKIQQNVPHHEEPNLTKCSFGVTSRLPNDYVVLDLNTLEPLLQEEIRSMLRGKHVSQGFTANVLIGLATAQSLDVPPVPFSIQTAILVGRIFESIRHDPDQVFYAALLLGFPLTRTLNVILSMPFAILRNFGQRLAGDDGGSSNERYQIISSCLPYAPEVLSTKYRVRDILRGHFGSDRLISTAVIDNGVLAQYNRGQIDDIGRLVLSKSPHSKYSSRVAPLKALHRLASWHFPFRRASFEVSKAGKKEKAPERSPAVLGEA